MAVDIHEESGANLLTVKASRKLTSEEYYRLVPAMEAVIQRVGTVSLLLILSDFHGWDLRSAWEDVKVDAQLIADIERMAIVGEASWEEYLVGFCRPLTPTAIRYFDAAHLEAAREWLDVRAFQRQLTL